MRGDLSLRVRPVDAPRAREVGPETLNRAIDETLLARWLFRWNEHTPQSDEIALSAWEGDGFFARERKRRSVLLVKLAAELYRREQGAAPATADALLQGYLKALPEGISRTQSIPSGVER